MQKKGATLVSLTTVKGDTFSGKVFIDATYEGDLMALAGVKYHVGREARSVYDESLAGVQKRRLTRTMPNCTTRLVCCRVSRILRA